VNVYSILYVNLLTEENIHRTNHVCMYFYFLGLRFRSTIKPLDPFVEKRSHVTLWNWVQLFHPNKFYLKRTRVTVFIIDQENTPISARKICKIGNRIKTSLSVSSIVKNRKLGHSDMIII
jgi:hypothetical protein